MRPSVCAAFLFLACAPPSTRDAGIVDGGVGQDGGRDGGRDAGVGFGDAGVDAGIDPCWNCPRGSVCGQDGCLFLCGECQMNAECGAYSCSSRSFCAAPLTECSLSSEVPLVIDVKYSNDQCSPLVGDCSIELGVELASGIFRADLVALDGGVSMSRQLSTSELALVRAARFSCVDAGFWQEYPLGCVAHDWQLSVVVRYPSGIASAFDLYRGQARRPPVSVDDALDVLLLRAVEVFVDAGVL